MGEKSECVGYVVENVKTIKLHAVRSETGRTGNPASCDHPGDRTGAHRS